MSNEYVVVRQTYNWADEIDFEGFFIVRTEEWDRLKNVYEHEVRYPATVNLGTNEDLEFESYEEYISTFNKIEYLTADEFSFMKKAFGKPSTAEYITLGKFVDIEHEDCWAEKDEDEYNGN